MRSLVSKLPFKCNWYRYTAGAYGLIAVGYVLVIVYIALFFAFGGGKGPGQGCGINGSAPGVATGVAACLVIMVSTFAALGGAVQLESS